MNVDSGSLDAQLQGTGGTVHMNNNMFMGTPSTQQGTNPMM